MLLYDVGKVNLTTEAKRVNPHIFSYCIDISVNALRSKGVRNIREALYNNRGDLGECIRYLGVDL
jgi:hypothetical protein